MGTNLKCAKKGGERMEQMQAIGTFIMSFVGGMIFGAFGKNLFDACVEGRVREELRKRGIEE